MTEANEFIADLKKLVSDTNVPDYAPAWDEIPQKYQDDFKAWSNEYKQQDWEGAWQRGWDCYNREFVAYVIDRFILTQAGVITSKEAHTYDEDCCGGHPDMVAFPNGCPTCGCKSAWMGNPPFVCDNH